MRQRKVDGLNALVVLFASAGGLVVLLGLPPFAMFASELSISRALAGAHLEWALGLAKIAADGRPFPVPRSPFPA